MLMNHNASLVWLGAPAALAAATVPAAAQVYMSEAQALAALFGETAAVRREQKSLTDGQRQKLQEMGGLRFPEPSYTFFLAEQKGKLAGYALVLDEIGKSEPITFMVGMSPEGKVTDVMVMVFRESRGWEVKEKRFLRQFRGKTASDPIRLNQDILNYSGATLSSRALARGVKRALLLLDVLYPPAARQQGPHAGRLVVPEPPAAIATAGELGLYRQARYGMGTLCEIRVWCGSAADAARAAAWGFAELRRLDAIFSNYRDDSELASVNRHAAGGGVAVSPEFWELTRYAVQQWRHSRGAFDITVGPLVKTWGFFDRRPRVPSPVELAEALVRVGADKLVLDPRRRTARFLRGGMELDFGGLAKGYAAARAAHCACQASAVASLVNLGGSSLCASGVAPASSRRSGTWLASTHDAGNSPAGSRRHGDAGELAIGEWPVAIADPQDPAQPARMILLFDGWALSTSGTYEQRFEAGGRTLSHLLDPRTGWPVEGFRSATVMARSARRTEVLAKRFLVATGVERETFLTRGFRGSDWILLDAEGARLDLCENLRHTPRLVPIKA